MLVLTRKTGEKVVLPQQEVVVTVLDVNGGRVRIGIEAPPHIRVHRQEIWDRIQHEESEESQVTA